MATRYEEMFKVLPEIAPCSVAAGGLAKKAFDLLNNQGHIETDKVSVNSIGSIGLGETRIARLSSVPRYGVQLVVEKSVDSGETGYISIKRGRALGRIAMISTLGDGPCNFIAFGDPDTEIGSMEITNDQVDMDRSTRLELITALTDEIENSRKSSTKRAMKMSVVGENSNESGQDDVVGFTQNPVLAEYVMTRYREIFGEDFNKGTYKLQYNISQYSGYRLYHSVQVDEDLGNGVKYDGSVTYRADIIPSDTGSPDDNFVTLNVRPDAMPDAEFSPIAKFMAGPAGAVVDISSVSQPKDLSAAEVEFLNQVISQSNNKERVQLPVAFRSIPDSDIPRTKLLRRAVKDYGKRGVLPSELQSMYDLASRLKSTAKEDRSSKKFLSLTGYDIVAVRTVKSLQTLVCDVVNVLPLLSADEQRVRLQIIHEYIDEIEQNIRRYQYAGTRELLGGLRQITNRLGFDGGTESRASIDSI